MVRTFWNVVDMSGVKWSAELEVALFHSMHGHKPAGEIQSLYMEMYIFLKRV